MSSANCCMSIVNTSLPSLKILKLVWNVHSFKYLTGLFRSFYLGIFFFPKRLKIQTNCVCLMTKGSWATRTLQCAALIPGPWRDKANQEIKLCREERGVLFCFFFPVGLAWFFFFFFLHFQFIFFIFCCEGKLLCEGIRSGPLTAR